jgi:hypothetical protein
VGLMLHDKAEMYHVSAVVNISGHNDPECVVVVRGRET